MKVKLSTVILSHLSDIQQELGNGFANSKTGYRLKFVKYLLLHYPDTTQEIDPEELWEVFISKFVNYGTQDMDNAQN